MNRNERTHVAAAVTTAVAMPERKTLTRREWGRRAILAGWIITMLGVVGYVFAMMRAGEDAGILQALASQGLLGWGSAVLLLGGVGTWIAGNLAFIRDLADLPPSGGEEE